MPPPRKSKTTPQKHELEAFAEKYDTFALIYGDPIETVFAIMARAAKAGGDDELALSAADTLMGYRFPKVKAAEVVGQAAATLNFNVTMAPPKQIEPPVMTLVRE